MISLSKVYKQYGKQILFVDASFQLNPGEKVGLVGPNGSGKTTLFRMIVGEQAADEGDVSVPKKLTIGYFRQDVEEMSGRSALDEAIAGSGRLGDLHHELEELQHAMGDPARADDMDRILERFGEVQEEYEHLGGYGLEAQAREVLHGLGFEDDWIDGDVGALSGGWKMRVAMARVLLGRPEVLLMDEPTNHLDIESIIWLEEFLKSLPGALVMTSHDREFLNRVVSKVAEIDSGEIIVYSGSYDFYEREREIREANREAAYARQQAMLAKEQRFIERFAAHAAKAAQVQSRVKALEKIEKIELPKKRRVVKFNFRPPLRSGDQVAVIDDVSKAYGSRVVYDHLNMTIRRGERWCVMGKNGAGKTTLLRMVAGVLPPAEIERAVVDQIRQLIQTPEIIVRTWEAARQRDAKITEREVREALERFDPLWNELFPAEQARIVQLLVERVDVTLDGVDIRDLTLQSLRSQIGIVTQQTFLFNDTVRNNIAYGDRSKSMEQIAAAAKAAHAHDFIMALPEAYDAVVGELGTKLSGGERQRLSIARALLKDPPILILDEATSSLDSESERLVQDALERLMVGRTTLVIAHRLSTIRKADRIVVLVGGRVVEQGTHEELLARKAEYNKLYALQFSESTEEGDGGKLLH